MRVSYYLVQEEHAPQRTDNTDEHACENVHADNVPCACISRMNILDPSDLTCEEQKVRPCRATTVRKKKVGALGA